MLVNYVTRSGMNIRAEINGRNGQCDFLLSPAWPAHREGCDAARGAGRAGGRGVYTGCPSWLGIARLLGALACALRRVFPNVEGRFANATNLCNDDLIKTQLDLWKRGKTPETATIIAHRSLLPKLSRSY
ncbi:hypothetical protein GCM10012289_08720 [Nonomuraea cavernae]|uniref:Uncharacterized protein n=1 Tax=Nonomuraea cavernae TaxID=2045107 RepID=A0A918DFH9_9ACTN|nr:hypothetical protein GCM10012289_08720 [Nonomuraea cavernae]